jgi:trk system potassium uptake protein TrkH
MVHSFYLDSIEFKAQHILRNILKLTFGIEFAGALLLWLRFRTTVDTGAVFYAVFHAVSAFCNAGFSLFSDSLTGYHSDPILLGIIMILIICGGLGFLVYNDIFNVLRKGKKRISLHTRMVLVTTGSLILIGAVLFFVLEYRATGSTMSFGDRMMNALFQSITPRTAGFNTVDESQLTAASKFITIILMFIGGSPASIAGGIKTTTFVIVFLAVIKDLDWKGKIRVNDRMIPSSIVTRAMLFLGKAVGLLGISIFLLTISEMGRDPSIRFFTVVFESVSAFGTVGLSTGLTPNLTFAGKLVIIATMFSGRVGLISLTIPLFKDHEDVIDYPEEEVLIG